MTKKRCYIAGLIGNLPLEEFTANFEQAEKEVKALGMIPISPLNLAHDHNKSWISYMKEDLTELLKCEVLYAQKNIRFSPGGMIEMELAAKIGIDIIHQK